MRTLGATLNPYVTIPIRGALFTLCADNARECSAGSTGMKHPVLCGSISVRHVQVCFSTGPTRTVAAAVQGFPALTTAPGVLRSRGSLAGDCVLSTGTYCFAFFRSDSSANISSQHFVGTSFEGVCYSLYMYL